MSTGQWARTVAPRWTFTIFDIAARLGVSVRWAWALVKRHEIPYGVLSRIVRLSDGSLRKRRVAVFSPSALEGLLLRHAGHLQTPSSHQGER